ncbi:MAG: hypothetical protein QGG36_02145 [Pirellulaceae bacterium]|jgi:hypothetical protein|nr:hypothetical protein [Pirellulaceae bacterium]MDP7014581.1 hypothetical protein [Pirellulaceae bacterium]
MRTIKEGGFEFRQEGDEMTVFVRRRKIGAIVTMVEANGRYCFRLASDHRKEPRTYRGRLRAARALQIIDNLKRKAEKQDWSADELIINAWDDKPHTAPN